MGHLDSVVDIRIFETVARLKNMSLGVKDLDLTINHVSKRLKRLEEQVDHRLVNRTLGSSASRSRERPSSINVLRSSAACHLRKKPWAGQAGVTFSHQLIEIGPIADLPKHEFGTIWTAIFRRLLDEPYTAQVQPSALKRGLSRLCSDFLPSGKFMPPTAFMANDRRADRLA